jgi:predicted DNA-binding transcriptional regulator YafY
MSRVHVERIHWIDAQIRAHHYPNAAKVAAQFGISVRAAYDDYRYLRERLGAPIRNDSHRGGWHYTEPTYSLPFLALPEREADALRRSLLAAQAYLGPADAVLIDNLLERMSAYFPIGQSAESMGGLFGFAPGVTLDPELAAACRLAVRKRRRLWLRYWSAHEDRESERVVQPARLFHYLIEPHLVAWCEWRRDLRQFLLTRVRAWRLLEEEDAFTPVPETEIDRFVQQGFGAQHGREPVTVRARFTPYQSRWIRERQYHPSQRTEELPDGGLLLTLRVAGIEEVKRWLLGYGAEVEVLEPAELQASIREELQKMATIYGGRTE